MKLLTIATIVPAVAANANEVPNCKLRRSVSKLMSTPIPPMIRKEMKRTGTLPYKLVSDKHSIFPDDQRVQLALTVLPLPET